MEVLEASLARRKIRQFEDRPVPDELVEKLLRAAMIASGATVGRPQS